MSEKPDERTSVPSAPEVETARLAARRKLTRAGLAAPVVLGTLASKPVLGAPLYHCTVSGHVSGGSPHEGDNVSCAVGRSRQQWLDTQGGTSWPTIIKGTLPNAACKWEGQGFQGTVFNSFGPQLPGLPALASTFFYEKDSGNCTVSTTGTDAATMYQVLDTTDASQIFQLGRATIVSLLNHFNDTTNYPVTAHTIIAMFNAASAGQFYVVNSAVSWSPTDVLNYLTSLYPPGQPPA